MDHSQIFTWATFAMLVPWAMMIVAPRGRWTEQVAFLGVVVFAGAAAWVVWRNAMDGQSEGDLFSLDGLSRFFQDRDMMLAGWLNYLAFSLCAGIWQVHDSREIKMGHLPVIPGLVLTMCAGPVGLLVYFLFRRMKTGAWQVR